jgi:hypothetical protein
VGAIRPPGVLRQFTESPEHSGTPRAYAPDVREVPPPYPEYYEQSTTPTNEYRVVLWEQPPIEGLDPEQIGWGEMTIDLVEVEDVHEAIEWAERRIAESDGPYSRGGVPVRDREYVLYAKVPGEDRFLQIAGWDPSRNPDGDNLRRREKS